MKTMRFAALLVITLSTVNIQLFAHKEHVHQYICREAYELIVLQTGIEIPGMREHLGNTETGDGAFNPGGKIVIGAYREDWEDVVWWYGFYHWPLEETAAVTHFWDPDQGDGSTFRTDYCGVTPYYYYPNAYQKVLKYAYGGWELKVFYAGVGITESYDAPSSLPQYYKDGSIYYRGYYQSNGVFVPRGYWVTSPRWFVDRVVWELLGRMAHLLQDMSVPAHAHNDQHDPICGGTDSFEQTLGSIYTNYSRQSALNAGGIINVNSHSNPMKYLFYTASQISGHFPSDDVQGNNSAGANEPFSSYPPLGDIISSLGQPPSSVNPSQIANTTVVYSIRATAGLFYWFAKHAGLLPPAVQINGPTIAPCATGTWTASMTDGFPPFTYRWYHMWDCYGGGGELTQSLRYPIVPDVPCNPTWNLIGSNSPTLNFYLCGGSSTLRVDVTDALGRVATDQHYVYGYGGGGGAIAAPENSGRMAPLIPKEYAIAQNYPNPFNPTTEIRFTLPEPSVVRLVVLDMLGREVATVADRGFGPGFQRVSWNGEDANGHKVGSGIYFCRITATGESGATFNSVLKMNLMK